jgi:hypothetical protein
MHTATIWSSDTGASGKCLKANSYGCLDEFQGKLAC